MTETHERLEECIAVNFGQVDDMAQAMRETVPTATEAQIEERLRQQAFWAPEDEWRILLRAIRRVGGKFVPYPYSANSLRDLRRQALMWARMRANQ